LRRTASFDVLSVNIGLTDSRRVNVYEEQKSLGVLSPNFFY